MSTLSDRIDAMCEERGITGYRLCKDIGISPNIMTELRSGRREGLNAKTADKIASYFGVSVSYLLHGDDDSTVSILSTNSAVAQAGNNSGTITATNGPAAPAADGYSEQTREMIRIFESLDMRAKNKALSYLYELEDGMDK